MTDQEIFELVKDELQWFVDNLSTLTFRHFMYGDPIDEDGGWRIADSADSKEKTVSEAEAEFSEAISNFSLTELNEKTSEEFLNTRKITNFTYYEAGTKQSPWGKAINIKKPVGTDAYSSMIEKIKNNLGLDWNPCCFRYFPVNGYIGWHAINNTHMADRLYFTYAFEDNKSFCKYFTEGGNITTHNETQGWNTIRYEVTDTDLWKAMGAECKKFTVGFSKRRPDHPNRFE